MLRVRSSSDASEQVPKGPSAEAARFSHISDAVARGSQWTPQVKSQHSISAMFSFTDSPSSVQKARQPRGDHASELDNRTPHTKVGRSQVKEPPQETTRSHQVEEPPKGTTGSQHVEEPPTTKGPSSSDSVLSPERRAPRKGFSAD